jgi:hypothetical protein
MKTATTRQLNRHFWLEQADAPGLPSSTRCDWGERPAAPPSTPQRAETPLIHFSTEIHNVKFDRWDAGSRRGGARGPRVSRARRAVIREGAWAGPPRGLGGVEAA